MNGAQHIPEEDLALYAMQALSPEETRAVQAHLDVCPACRQAVSEALGDLALVGASVELQPLPQGARERFMQRIGADSNLATSSDRSTRPAHSEATVTAMPRRSLFGTIGWLAAAAALFFAAWLANQDHNLRQQLNAQRWQVTQLAAKADRAQDLMDALTSRSAQRVTLTEGKQTAKPAGHATYLPSRGALIFTATNMRPLPSNKTYELWLIPANGTGPVPAGLFRPDATGSASVVLPALPQGVPAKAFGITIENAVGSTTPTLPIILSGS
ncbi:anti-sigma factor [Acidipila rosea]|uniref:Regulator of SigK n=1 Tax=Acidipila rosea TaxID=768535 RepID=A0A4V2PVB6_9BACT|nr:anti-sigma factor [Acidipila rosea]TCK73741.1 anti-sigma-K factor RskA [Acidipila rosea]